jgi:hypothetical protein
VNDSLLCLEAEACLQELENCIFYSLSIECYDVIVSTRIVGPSTELFRFATALWLCVYLDSAVGIGRYGRYIDWLRPERLRGCCSSPDGARIFTSHCRPDRLWGPPSLLSNW